jgi:glutaredoxin
VRAEPATRQLLLVTTADCHLCERAHEVLEHLGVETRDLDVASDEAQTLAERGLPLLFLPVLTDGERVLAYGRFSEPRLRRELGL